MLHVYEEFMKNVLAIPVITGQKSESEKFAGAGATYTMEAMMRDGKSLQAGTSHYLGQNFAKAFDIKFLDKDEQLKYPYQTSWGVSTRLIGALIMAHGDQRGLALPPRVAPVQVVIVPIAQKKEGVLDKVYEVKSELEKSGIRVLVDDSEQSPGWKFNEWEMKGVPLRLEIGPRDIENNVAMSARRDTHDKAPLSLDGIAENVSRLLDDIHENMYNTAKVFLDNHIVVAKNYDELKDAIAGKNFVKAMWCGDPECEAEIKAETGATTRAMPFDQTPVGVVCVHCGKPAKYVIYFAKSYELDAL